MGAYEVFADCNADGTPDPALDSAVSRTANPTSPGGFCTTEEVLPENCRSGPHQFGISGMRFTFDDAPIGSRAMCGTGLLYRRNRR